ncbi:hypothetical protein Q428_02760 [Fervidicella metallireducens AeB]|uniref:DUF1284 domain-containing protein n=1 Tax=Fervidicella metallireducens AeB TaxID=1403537 RepID=A0A017RX63_9CLOT|nr:DUF1284 domain-containing protein [Fervidicella metallireducens]EYE89368.1 hypothetical protein Q428_02760 [Fervidicella metallireducens AeB]
MLVLRPHHILCIQGYRGKGYNEEFVSNMNEIVYLLKNNPSTRIKLITKTDSICKYCPSNIGEGLCKFQNKVADLDEKTLLNLSLKKEHEYIYSDILSYIKENLTLEKFESICKECEWYKFGYCLDGLFKFNEIL